MWKRRLIYAGLVVAFAAALVVGWQYYLKLSSNKELRDAIAEADRLDPGWRLEELEAKREVFPDKENSAVQVLAIKEMMPKPWPPDSMMVTPEAKYHSPEEPRLVPVEEEIYELPPEIQLSPKHISELRKAVEMVKVPMAQARTLASYRCGRYPVQWLSDYHNTRLRSHDCRIVTNLLSYDLRLRAQDRDVEGALTSVLCILGVARSIGDEPNTLSQLIRKNQCWVATEALERILAQCQSSPNSLSAIQAVFEDEASHSLFLIGVRGQRAGEHQMMEAIAAGKLDASTLLEFSPRTFGDKVKAARLDINLALEFKEFHAPYLRAMTKIVEIAKQETEFQRPKIKSLVKTIDEGAARGELPVNLGLEMPLLERFGEGCWMNQALLRCAIAALATERYRLAHGHWPDSLEMLVPEFLAKIPPDPFDAKPLRYRQFPDGVVIYSIGPDEQDNGGKLDRQDRKKPGTDIGFQLWDVKSRRQPWRPPAKKIPPNGD